MSAACLIIYACSYQLFFVQNLAPFKEGYADTPPPLRSGANFMKDAECAESKEKSYLRFFRFFIFRDIVKIHQKLPILSKT